MEGVSQGNWEAADTDCSYSHLINPFTAPACKMSRLKCARRRLQHSKYFAPLTSTFYAVRKRRQKGFKVSNFALSLVGFKRYHDSEGVIAFMWRHCMFKVGLHKSHLIDNGCDKLYYLYTENNRAVKQIAFTRSSS